MHLCDSHYVTRFREHRVDCKNSIWNFADDSFRARIFLVPSWKHELVLHRVISCGCPRGVTQRCQQRGKIDDDRRPKIGNNHKEDLTNSFVYWTTRPLHWQRQRNEKRDKQNSTCIAFELTHILHEQNATIKLDVYGVWTEIVPRSRLYTGWNQSAASWHTEKLAVCMQ